MENISYFNKISGAAYRKSEMRKFLRFAFFFSGQVICGFDFIFSFFEIPQ
jgi:hypothetical protein